MQSTLSCCLSNPIRVVTVLMQCNWWCCTVEPMLFALVMCRDSMLYSSLARCVVLSIMQLTWLFCLRNTGSDATLPMQHSQCCCTVHPIQCMSCSCVDYSMELTLLCCGPNAPYAVALLSQCCLCCRPTDVPCCRTHCHTVVLVIQSSTRCHAVPNTVHAVMPLSQSSPCCCGADPMQSMLLHCQPKCS